MGLLANYGYLMRSLVLLSVFGLLLLQLSCSRSSGGTIAIVVPKNSEGVFVIREAGAGGNSPRVVGDSLQIVVPQDAVANVK
jgi:hypothetical protein